MAQVVKLEDLGKKYGGFESEGEKSLRTPEKVYLEGSTLSKLSFSPQLFMHFLRCRKRTYNCTWERQVRGQSSTHLAVASPSIPPSPSRAGNTKYIHDSTPLPNVKDCMRGRQ